MVEGSSSQSSGSDSGGRLPSISDLRVGDELGHYRLLVTHRGGMGEIFVAEDLDKPGGYVVIKRLLEDFVEDETYLSMFRDEARIMSQFHHPNIVRVLETPVLRGGMCLVMELVRGRNVMQILQKTQSLGARIPAAIAVHIMSEALRGLHYAHCAVDPQGRPLELVHRDVSPGNLLVSFGGDVKVTDFGIAKSRMSVVATSVGVVKGTTRYLSPEQVRGGEVTPRSDLFACASVLLEMLTGVAVFERGQVPPTLLAIVKGKRKSVGELLPFSEPRLELLLEQALSLGPTQRPESAAAMADALDALRPSLGPAASAQSVGDYLTRLFPDDELEASSRAHLIGAEIASTGHLQPRTAPGARPLDATEFEAKTSKDLGTPPAERGLDAIEHLSADPEPPSTEPPGVSDSVVAADAFAMSGSHPTLVAPFSMRTFMVGAAFGAVVMYGVMLLQPTQAKPARSTRPVAHLPPPVYVPPVTTRFKAVASITASTATAAEAGEGVGPVEASKTLVVAAPGFLTVRTRRKGWILVYLDGKRVMRRRLPLKRPLRVPSGSLRVLMKYKKRKWRREVEVEVLPGVHLDLTNAEIQTVEDGEKTP